LLIGYVPRPALAERIEALMREHGYVSRGRLAFADLARDARAKGYPLKRETIRHIVAGRRGGVRIKRDTAEGLAAVFGIPVSQLLAGEQVYEQVQGVQRRSPAAVGPLTPFPERLRALREARGISQAGIEELGGPSEGSVRKWEAGK
jgi:transcriptional regulator with XRE-family HTH domain